MVDQSPPPTSCCASKEKVTSSCCPSEQAKQKLDWLLWGAGSMVVIAYGLHLAQFLLPQLLLPQWLVTMSRGMAELVNTMWWGVLIGILFVGLLTRVPQALITSVIGQAGTKRGLLRATLAGVLLDLCSHGILMVGMQLYQRGASIGQVMAFLIASPWNSLSLTIILISLIGLPWTLAFIVLSAIIALITGWLFDSLVERGVLPANPTQQKLAEDYQFWPEFKKLLATVTINLESALAILKEGLKSSRMVLRWLLVGIVLAGALRGFLSLDDFQQWFGPTMVGLAVTLVMATIIEVCSEGSTPIAADLLTRANAPGNSFAFMMTGVATDYTEVMVIKDTTTSWKIALFLPLLTVPQVVIIAWLINTYAA